MKYTIEKLFIKGKNRNTETLKKYLIEHNLKNYQCEVCENGGYWNNEELILELDHIDGNNKNNEIDNLRFLCPNCHSQTNTYRGRNINNGEKKISDERFKNALMKEDNIRQALISLGLTPKGGNYIRANKIADKYNIKLHYSKEKICENLGCNIKHTNNLYCSRRCYHDHKNKSLKISQRKVKRPSYEVFKKELQEMNYSSMGRKYGVSDNAIRKWEKMYNTYHAEVAE